MCNDKQTYAKGGRPALGEPDSMMQIAGMAPGSKPYEPSRDVINFFPYLMAGIARYIKDRDIPAFADDTEDFEVLKAVANSIGRLLAVIADRRITTYEKLSEVWLRTENAQVADIVLKLLGRGILEFFGRCYMQVRQLGALGDNISDIIEEVLGKEWLTNELRKITGQI